MSWRLELALTVVVCAAGGGYFVWRALSAGEERRLMYVAFIIAGAALAQRAVKDVLARRRRELDRGEDG